MSEGCQQRFLQLMAVAPLPLAMLVGSHRHPVQISQYAIRELQNESLWDFRMLYMQELIQEILVVMQNQLGMRLDDHDPGRETEPKATLGILFQTNRTQLLSHRRNTFSRD